MPREKPSSKINLQLCVFHGAGSHSWRTAPYVLDRRKTDDRELWEDIRSIYRTELENPWRRFLYFKKIKLIAPITYTANGVPIKQDEKDFPDKHSYMHAYHHPDHIRTVHEWVDFFSDFRMQAPAEKTIGLEFMEGLYAEKLALVAILMSIAIVVVSIVWCVKGGDLQTVFTVMGFVLTFAAGESGSTSQNRIILTMLALCSRNRACGTVLPGHAAELADSMQSAPTTPAFHGHYFDNQSGAFATSQAPAAYNGHSAGPHGQRKADPWTEDQDAPADENIFEGYDLQQ